LSLADCTVIVTGATGNLGAAVSRVLAGRGARLVLVDRTGDRLPAFVGSLPTGADVLPLSGFDLADPASARAMVAAATDRFGAVTGLVNTVGGFDSAPVDGGAEAQFDRLMTLNAGVALTLSAAVLPAMAAAGWGRIVHVSAMPALKAPVGLAAYAAAKSAVIRIVEAVAAEQRSHGISANAVLPGTIDTPENRRAMPGAKTDGWVAPDAIAEAIAFLVSRPGGVVTGAAIPVTGPA
jgi:NAD(P)-dependent dehydrogenase (short-subunit alcohol dehydrogenase family)